MGSDGGYLQPNSCHLNGLLPDKAASLTGVLDMERWRKAEERTAELIAHIQPDHSSWENRNAVASYVQRLITKCFPCVVFIYGSVPLKTYLPDGDIDLTVFSEDQNSNDNCAAKVRDILEKEGNNGDAEYKIKEVQLIRAEVKLVKCLVDNIVVDISFNQLGGLSTLCFLEQVDEYISQNHLFKRSVILIKAWCYYESRLLGAYHGLISTYALETLILYIFHVFNNSFSGPLEVLYRFLVFFSNFDWDNFCISLQGPVPIRSLPDMTADPPRKDGGALFLNKRFLDTCTFNYSVHPNTPELKEQFGAKHFNIIDFLRINNNLGRSVSRGNFFRIRTAFSFGAKRLAGLMDCSKENVVTELNQFFVNTWDVDRKFLRPDTHFAHASGFVNRCQTENGKLVDDPGFWVYDASSSIQDNLENGLFFKEYTKRKQNPTSAQTNVFCHSDGRKQNELIMENGDSVGKNGSGKEFLCCSFTGSMSKVSSGKWKDGSRLMSNDPLDDRLWKAFTTDCKPFADYTQCHPSVFQHFCHEVSNGIPFSNSETKVLPTEAHYTCTSTPDWVHITSMPPDPCSRRTAVHNPSLYPVTSHPGGPWPDYSCKSKVCTFDILRGDLASHFRNMLYARSCQNSKFGSPFVVPVQCLEEQFMLNDTDRSSKIGRPFSVNYTVLPETAVMPSLGHHSDQTSIAGGCAHFPEGIPRYGMENRISTLNLKSCRDLQSSRPKNRRGNYRYHRKELPKEREVAVGFHQWENPSARFDHSAGRNERVHMQWKALGEQASYTQAKRVSDHLV